MAERDWTAGDVADHFEEAFRTLGLASPDLDDRALVDAMAAHPELIERPILVRGNRAVIGRPTERLLTLLD